MSRRRGEFEHRTSIFEGAFRAWSHLGGLDPLDLESKAPSDLDPLTFPLENDPRLLQQKEKEKKDKKAGGGSSNAGGGSQDGLDDDLLDNGGLNGVDDFGQLPPGGGGAAALEHDALNGGKRREYPYEPLPRSGLAHPFVQAILSPWLGPDADQDAIQLGLTTLRTWWQHRRKGESGSAIVALGTEKMRGVVEGYTRHFFNLAHCLIVNDKEQPPRTLQAKMRDLEKTRNKKSKKRSREDDSLKIAAMAFKSGFGGAGGGGGGGIPSIASNDLGMGLLGGGGIMGGGVAGGNNIINNNNNNNNISNQESMLNSLELLHAAQRRQLAESGGVHSNLPGAGGLAAAALENHSAAATTNNVPIEIKQRCMPGKVDLPGLVQQVSSAATQLAHRGMIHHDPSELYGGGGAAAAANTVDPSKYGDPSIHPVVLVSQNGDIQFFMRIDGITCAHCVKIVETVLKGCQGNRSPINGLLDASADRELNLVLIKIEKTADARRIAFEATRNLNMVGYTAKARSVNINDISKGGGDVSLQSLCYAFDVMPNVNPMSVFNWHLDCACPDNGVLRQNCTRHSQMSRGIIEVFDKTERLASEIVAGCGKKYGMPCSAGMNCFCRNNVEQKIQEQFNGNNMHQYSAGNMSYQQPIQDNSQGGNEFPSANQMGGAGRLSRTSMRMSLGGLGRHFSVSEGTTFGRAMSGLSALSIDWENMEDFDINVDHSAHINNDIINQQQQDQNYRQNLKEDGNGAMDGNDGGGYGQNGMNYDNTVGRIGRRSSLRRNIPIDPNANLNNVSFNI